MGLLAPLAALLGIELDDLIERMRGNAVAWSVFAVFALIGLAFLLVALNVALTGWIGPLWAPVCIGAGALLAALAVFIGIQVSDGAAARRAAKRRHAAETTALATTAAAAALPALLKSDLLVRVGIPVGGVLAAAWMLRHKPNGAAHEEAED